MLDPQPNSANLPRGLNYDFLCLRTAQHFDDKMDREVVFEAYRFNQKLFGILYCSISYLNPPPPPLNSTEFISRNRYRGRIRIVRAYLGVCFQRWDVLYRFHFHNTKYPTLTASCNEIRDTFLGAVQFRENCNFRIKYMRKAIECNFFLLHRVTVNWGVIQWYCLTTFFIGISFQLSVVGQRRYTIIENLNQLTIFFK